MMRPDVYLPSMKPDILITIRVPMDPLCMIDNYTLLT